MLNIFLVVSVLCFGFVCFLFLFFVFCFFLPVYFVLFVFVLYIVCPILSVSLDCSFLTDPSDSLINSLSLNYTFKSTSNKLYKQSYIIDLLPAQPFSKIVRPSEIHFCRSTHVSRQR